MRINPAPADVRGPTDTITSRPRGAFATWHSLFARNRFYPAAACSLLGCALLIARWYWSGHLTHVWFLWNLFLAWLPWLFALPLDVLPAQRGKAWKLVPLFAAWLIFLPNAPYIVTDLLHLTPQPPIPFWFDSAMFFVFAWTGCVLGFASLSIVHARIERWKGKWFGWAFVGVSALLTGFGIYLGRFLRWNSWDVVTHPKWLLEDFVDRVANSDTEHPRVVVFTVLFAAFFVAAYGSVRTLRASK